MNEEKSQAIDINTVNMAGTDCSLINELFIHAKKYSRGGLTSAVCDVIQKDSPIISTNFETHLALTAYYDNIMKNSAKLFKIYCTYSRERILNPEDSFIRNIRCQSMYLFNGISDILKERRLVTPNHIDMDADNYGQFAGFANNCGRYIFESMKTPQNLPVGYNQCVSKKLFRVCDVLKMFNFLKGLSSPYDQTKIQAEQQKYQQKSFASQRDKVVEEYIKQQGNAYQIYPSYALQYD